MENMEEEANGDNEGCTVIKGYREHAEVSVRARKGVRSNPPDDDRDHVGGGGAHVVG